MIKRVVDRHPDAYQFMPETKDTHESFERRGYVKIIGPRLAVATDKALREFGDELPR
tara:strand:- start:19276 stop:19446 length:171 start_codon:yes stop_codon:yes gene_type:complete